jgi:hypothetical protein
MALCLLKLLFLKQGNSVLKAGGLWLILNALLRRLLLSRRRQWPALGNRRLTSKLLFNLRIFLSLVNLGSRVPRRGHERVFAWRRGHELLLDKGTGVRTGWLQGCHWRCGGLIKCGDTVFE